jgi:hypothetical protein
MDPYDADGIPYDIRAKYNVERIPTAIWVSLPLHDKQRGAMTKGHDMT